MRLLTPVSSNPVRRFLAGHGGTALVLAVVSVWLTGIGGGLAVLATYANTAPAMTAAPDAWPAASSLPREPGRVSLIIFIHPKCPCSSATLTELNRVLTRAPGGHTIVAAFYAPSSEPPGWGRTALRRRAESLPGVRVIDDIDAREAILFGAANSGHVVVYGPDGEARFRGGITASRGHEGDNLGADCVIDALGGREPAAAATPTFGCEIAQRVETGVCPECDQEAGQ